MAFQQSDLDKIDAAISSGVRSVTFADGRRTEYQNVADMLRARDMIRGEVDAASSTGRRRRLTILRVGCR